MIEFPEYREKAKIGDIEFEIMDLSVKFFEEVERDNELYNDNNILKDGTTLTDAQILKLGNRSKLAIVNKVLDITNPDRDKNTDEEVEKKN